MTDYYRLIGSAVAALKDADHARRTRLYDCARAALVKELSCLTPPLSGSDITRERSSLEAAICAIEADVSDGSQQAEAGCSTLSARPAAESRREPSAPECGNVPTTHPEIDPHGLESQRGSSALNYAPPTLTLEALEALQLFRECLSEAERSGTQREIPAGQARAFAGSLSDRHRFASNVEPQNIEIAPRDRMLGIPELEPAVYRRPPQRRKARRQAAEAILPDQAAEAILPDQTAEAILPERARGSGKALLTTFIGVFLTAALLVVLYWQRDRLSTVLISAAPTTAQYDAVPPALEILGSIHPTGKQTASTADQPATDQVAEPVSQRAVLYEEDPADPNGKGYLGSVIWQTEPSSPEQPRAVRAQLEIPERHINMTMSLRPNADETLSATHTIEIVFKLAADFPFGGISEVLGILMKETEQTRGAPLAGLVVKVTPGMFLVGLSANQSDMQRNRELLDARSWFDIPIVYDNGRRAILAIEKGRAGQGAFKAAFAAWK